MKTFHFFLLMSCLSWPVLSARAQGTAFTYQGRFNASGGPYSGVAEMQFTLWSGETNGAQLAATLPAIQTLNVSNGFFTTTIDFGASFDGGERWLQIEARTAPGPLTPLTPRQKITSTPYALRAANFSGAVADNQLSTNIARLNAPATFTGPVSFSNVTGSFRGDASGLTNLNIASSFGGGVAFELGTTAFFLSSSPSVGTGPYSVVAADVNGDGKADLISANFYDSTLSVLTNNGKGGFTLSSSPVVGDRPDSVIAADVNGDGKVDLITANDSANTLTVLTNSGSGGFVLSSSPAVGEWPNSVVAMDVNGDGKLDLISANYAASTLTVLTNRGSGSFAIASSPAMGSRPYWITKSDVNGDGKVDLITANLDAQTLSVLTNNGSGGFVLASSPALGIHPEAVVAADVNRDGQMDLIVASDGNALAVLTNSGAGGFALSSSPVVSSAGYSVAAADVNGDGNVDLISTRYGAASLGVLTNDGSGGFNLATSPTVGIGPFVVVAADVNGDGKVDLVSANFAGGSGNTLSVLFNSRQLNGIFTGDGTGLGGVNAESLDGFNSTDFARLTADQGFSGNNVFYNTVQFFGANSFDNANDFFGVCRFFDDVRLYGDVTVNSGATMSFASQTRQMLNLWGVQYGIGVQSGTLYFRADNSATDNGFAWYRGGTHSDTIKDPGAGGGTLMTLDANRLAVNTAVGLGTANPAAKLHLYSTDNPTTFRIQSTGTPGFGRIEFVSNPQGDPSEWRPAYIQSLDAGGFTGGLGFYLNGTGSGNTFGNVEVMRLINGNVGIGVNSPQQQLSVATGMNIDQNDTNIGTVANTLRFGSGSGEAIGSKRNPGGNRWGLDFYTGSINRMTILNNGNVGIGTTTPSSALQVIGTVTATAFNPPSDRNLKENFTSVSPREVLEKVASMPISRWNFKGDTATPHVGPMAQDFHAAFGLGTDDKHIATVDADGVALAAIQGLNQKLEEQIARQKTELKNKENRLIELDRRLAVLEGLLSGIQKAE